MATISSGVSFAMKGPTTHITLYNTIRLLILALCFGLFLKQILQELDKYRLGLRSTATSLERIANVTYPVLTYCRKKPYKTNAFINSTSAYFDAVYSWNETFEYSYMERNFKKMLIDGIWLGRCYGIQFVGLQVGVWESIRLRGWEGIQVLVLSSDQLTCAAWGACDSLYQMLDLSSDVTDIIIMPRKNIRIINCSPNVDGEAYNKCLERAFVQKIVQSNVCKPPAMIVDHPDIKNCNSSSDQSSIIQDIQQDITREPQKYGCHQPCTTWSYDVKVKTLNKDTQLAILPTKQAEFAINYVRVASENILVQREYTVLDDYGFIASVGGSLGLFLGFSCYDCLSTFLITIKSLMSKKQPKMYPI